MTNVLTLSQKLEFLWKDVLSVVKEGVEAGGYPKAILDNFKPLTRRQVQGFISEAKRSPNCETCESNCCARLEGKILLTLKDVARLVDAGLADSIVGTYKGFSAILDQYLLERNPDVFSAVNVMMNEKMNETSYMPSLQKVDKLCVFLDEANRCRAYKVRPEACRRYPFDFDFHSHWITWDPACPSTQSLTEDQQSPIVSAILASENERLRDIALIMLDRDALKQIGFGDYL